MNYENNNKFLNSALVNLFLNAPAKCNCGACTALHTTVKNEIGTSKYKEICSTHGIYQH